MPSFKNGVSTNLHSGKTMKHLRIKAGPGRDRYVHDLVFEAKILGRREAFEHEHPGVPIPADDFYRYLDPTWETVDHHDQDSLNNDPANLNRMARSANTAKGNHHRKRNKTVDQTAD